MLFPTYFITHTNHGQLVSLNLVVPHETETEKKIVNLQIPGDKPMKTMKDLQFNDLYASRTPMSVQMKKKCMT